MNAFFEHPQNNIKFRYRCFDRLLLNGCIQSFLDGARAQGFFWVYRKIYPVSRNVLREVANQYHNWAERSAQEWGVEIVDDPKGRRDDFVNPYFEKAQPDQVGGVHQGARTRRHYDRHRCRRKVASGNQVSLGEAI